MHIFFAWSAASRVNGGRARSCGDSVTPLRDVGYSSLKILPMHVLREKHLETRCTESRKDKLFSEQPQVWGYDRATALHRTNTWVIDRSTIHSLNLIVSYRTVDNDTGVLAYYVTVVGSDGLLLCCSPRARRIAGSGRSIPQVLQQQSEVRIKHGAWRMMYGQSMAVGGLHSKGG